MYLLYQCLNELYWKNNQKEYRESVLPSDVRKRVAAEWAQVSDGVNTLVLMEQL